MTDEERLADIEAAWVAMSSEADDLVRGLLERVRALTAERDDLIVERDKWKTKDER